MGNPPKLVATALALLLIGVVLPLLMVIKLVQSTLFLNLLAAASAIAGITVGFLGITQYFRNRK